MSEPTLCRCGARIPLAEMEMCRDCCLRITDPVRRYLALGGQYTPRIQSLMRRLPRKATTTQGAP